MKTYPIQKEILLIAGTTFAQREWDTGNLHKTNDHLSKQQLLEQACRNGMLQEVLSELPCKYYDDDKLYLWLVREGQAYIQLEICKEPLIIEREFSLDPYLFLSAQIYN
jgi:hypothetical protein